MRKSRFELGHGEGWCDFEYPVAIRRHGQVVGWASEPGEASMLLYAVNARREPRSYMPPLTDKLSGGSSGGAGASLSVDTSGEGVAGCGVALTCGGRVLAWMKSPRHARFIAESVNRVSAGSGSGSRVAEA